MLLPIYENESSTASTDHYLNELSSRVAGGQDLQTDSQAKVNNFYFLKYALFNYKYKHRS